MQKLIYTVFYNKYFPVIQPLAELNKINPFFILSVAALETGFGKHLIQNNFFGIKASANHYNKFLSVTKEYSPSLMKLVAVSAYFRSYDGFLSSALDFCRLIRYKYPQCIGVNDHTVCSLLQSNAKRRYATDPDYSAKFESL